MDERDEEEANFITNPANWPDITDYRAWLRFSVRALRSELACCLDHLADGDANIELADREIHDYKFAKHIETIKDGVYETSRVHMESLPTELVVELTRQRLEERDGIPYKAVEVSGRYAFVPENVTVPNNLDGLDGSQNE